MHSAKEKVSNMASEAKGSVDKFKAGAAEKIEKTTVRTKEEERMAEERRKAKEGQAEMEKHQAKAEHAADKLQGEHHHHHHHHPVGTAAPMAGATAPTYPLGGHPAGQHHKYP